MGKGKVVKDPAGSSRWRSPHFADDISCWFDHIVLFLANTSIYRQTLKNNNKMLAKALDGSKQDLKLLGQKYLEMTSENQVIERRNFFWIEQLHTHYWTEIIAIPSE